MNSAKAGIFCSFYSLPNPQRLAEYLGHSRHLVNIWQKKKNQEEREVGAGRKEGRRTGEEGGRNHECPSLLGRSPSAPGELLKAPSPRPSATSEPVSIFGQSGLSPRRQAREGLGLSPRTGSSSQSRLTFPAQKSPVQASCLVLARLWWGRASSGIHPEARLNDPLL